MQKEDIVGEFCHCVMFLSSHWRYRGSASMSAEG